jgi:hypothetical protein
MLGPIKEIVDLADELYTGMPNIGDQQIAFWPIESFEGLRTITESKLAMESRMMLMAEHCGTHLDAPRHFDEAGLSVAQVPLEQLVLPGHLLDLTHRCNGEAITIGDFEAAEVRSGRAIGDGTAVICWTGCDKEWERQDGSRTVPSFRPTARNGSLTAASRCLRLISSEWMIRPSGGGRPMRSGCATVCAWCSNCIASTGLSGRNSSSSACRSRCATAPAARFGRSPWLCKSHLPSSRRSCPRKA